MTADLILYTNPMSRGRIARWMLEEVGEPYETKTVEYAAMKAPDYLAVNPMGKVPAIRHGAVIVTEAAAICAYLADAFPQAGLAPAPGSPDRGAYYRWLFFAAGPLEAAVTNRSQGWDAPDKRGMLGYGSYSQALDVLEAGVGRSEYLAGDRFTAADLYVGSHIGWGLMFKLIEDRPAFRDYVSRLQARPAAVRANQLDDALMPKAEAAA